MDQKFSLEQSDEGVMNKYHKNETSVTFTGSTKEVVYCSVPVPSGPDRPGHPQSGWKIFYLTRSFNETMVEPFYISLVLLPKTSFLVEIVLKLQKVLNPAMKS